MVDHQFESIFSLNRPFLDRHLCIHPAFDPTIMGGDFTHSWLSLPLSHSTFQSKADTSIFRGTEFDPYPYGTEVDLTIKHCGLPAAMMNEFLQTVQLHHRQSRFNHKKGGFDHWFGSAFGSTIQMRFSHHNISIEPSKNGMEAISLCSKMAYALRNTMRWELQFCPPRTVCG